MVWKNRLLPLGLASLLLPAPVALAADHQDGSMTGVQADASTDINDVYSFMSADGSHINLIMTVLPNAMSGAKFSNAAWYVFHTSSRATFLTMQNQAMAVDIICGFDAAQKIGCWVGSGNANYVGGDASDTQGITSTDGKIRVFAGMRKDHFFFNLDGFTNVRNTVKDRQNNKAITLDANGCALQSGANPNGLTSAEAGVVKSYLSKNIDGTGPAADLFKDWNALAIVLSIDKTLLNQGGPIFSVWGATHKK